MKTTKRILSFLLFLITVASVFAEKKYFYARGCLWSITDDSKIRLEDKSKNKIEIKIPGKGTWYMEKNENRIRFITAKDSGYTSFYFLDYENENLIPIYSLGKDDGCSVKTACYSNDYIYTLETEIVAYDPYDILVRDPLYITKRTAESKDIVKRYQLYYLRLSRSEFFSDIEVDENKDRVIFRCNDRSQDMHDIIRVFCLSTGEELFCHTTESTLTVDGDFVYYSDQNRLFKVNYTGTEFNSVEMKTFLPQKEKITNIDIYDDLYVVETKYPVKLGAFMYKFIFGHYPNGYNYYVCNMKNESLKKIKKLKKP